MTKASTLLAALGCHVERTDGDNMGFQDCNLLDAPADDESAQSPTGSPVGESSAAVRSAPLFLVVRWFGHFLFD